MTKPTQCAAFKRLWDQLMGVTEFQYPGPENQKIYRKSQVSYYGQKTARNEAPDHKYVW